MRMNDAHGLCAWPCAYFYAFLRNEPNFFAFFAGLSCTDLCASFIDFCETNPIRPLRLGHDLLSRLDRSYAAREIVIPTGKSAPGISKYSKWIAKRPRAIR